MRTVPADFANFIPVDARDDVAYVVDELLVLGPHLNPLSLEMWMWALSIWTARTVCSAIRESQEGG